MRIILKSEERVRFEEGGEPGLEIRSTSAKRGFSSFHMLAAALASCTDSVLRSWAAQAGIPTDNLAIDVGWDFADDPPRVSSLRVHLEWPGLPAVRRASAEQAASLCGVHHTLVAPTSVSVRFED